jgi:hypothetical protein
LRKIAGATKAHPVVKRVAARNTLELTQLRRFTRA